VTKVAASFFISDLHLATERPESTETFVAFLRNTADGAERLYILGDLFEYWVGDELLAEPLPAKVAAELRGLGATGTRVFFMHGNRDFLVGTRFAEAAGLTLLPDPSVVDLYGAPTLLMHGDTLCTGDVDYLRFRDTVRDPLWQAEFLAKPVADRKRLAESARSESEVAKKIKSMPIMDAAPAAVTDVLRKHDYPRLIHGHTHRPATHQHLVDGHTCERHVLADWYDRGSYLMCDAAGCKSVTIA
jgi:UDP-2,3-diacylglucosamine hydrolase